MSRTRHEVIVDHAGRLHQRVANCRARGARELESPPQQIPAHRIGFLSMRRHVRHTLPTILYRFAADEAPQLSVEGLHLFSERAKRFRVLDRRRDLEPVPHDSGVAE